VKSLGLVFGVLLGTAGIGVPSSRADDTRDVAAAEALFQDGRALLESGRVAEACPKLAESHRLDPATGTLIALAACHEKEGRLASAWAEFTEAAARASHELQSERRDLAAARVEQLRPRLSSLLVRVPETVASIPGLSIARSGRVLGRGEWNAALPIDGGRYAIEVAAPGYLPWRRELAVAAENDRAVVEVPDLRPEPKPLVKATLPRAPVRTPPSPVPARGLSRLEWFGIGTAGAGVAALGVGGYFFGKMLSKNADSKDDCKGNDCGTQGVADRNSARDAGNVATGLVIGGAVLVAAGGGLFFVGRSERNDRTPLSVSVQADGIRFSGAF
jgi:hypothetical protein